MQPGEPARILRIHVSERDRYEGKPLYEAIVAKCREMRIAGATVFRGVEGFGEGDEVHRSPVVVTIVDSAENLQRLVPVLEGMMQTGLMAMSNATVVRVQKPPR